MEDSACGISVSMPPPRHPESRPASMLAVGVRAIVAGIFLSMLSWAGAAEPSRKHYNVPADSADHSLKLFSEQAGLEVIFSTRVARAVKTNAVKGEMTARQALDGMLAGTTLVVVQDATSGAFTVTPRRAHESSAEPPANAAAEAEKKTTSQHPRTKTP